MMLDFLVRVMRVRIKTRLEKNFSVLRLRYSLQNYDLFFCFPKIFPTFWTGARKTSPAAFFVEICVANKKIRKQPLRLRFCQVGVA